MTATKALVAAVVQLLMVLGSWYLTGELDGEEFGLAIMGLVTVVGVYVAKNKPRDPNAEM